MPLSLVPKPALGSIKGIGPLQRLQLRRALNIKFAEDLLRYTSGEIYACLAKGGPATPQRQICQWQAQAQLLVRPLAQPYALAHDFARLQANAAAKTDWLISAELFAPPR